MPHDPDELLEEDRHRQLDLGDFTRGTQSVKAACGCLAAAIFLAVLIYAARHYLFR